MRTWATHLRSLKRASIFVGVAALFVAALFIFAMIKAGDYHVDAMAMVLMALILAMGIFLPARISNYAWGLYIVLLAARALIVGNVLGISMEDEPLPFWLATLFLFVSAGVFLHAAYRARNSQVPADPLGERNTPETVRPHHRKLR